MRYCLAVYTYWGKGPSKAEKNPELLFEKDEKPTKSFHLGIKEKASGKVIGDIYVYLIENDRMASVAIRLAPACQGKMVNTWCDYYIYGILKSDILIKEM